MVAIFTGLGPGFERGSAAQLGGNGVLGSGVQGRGGDVVSLNAATGRLLISRQDEFLVGRGPDVGPSRTYTSPANTLDQTTDNWRRSTDRRIYNHTGSYNTSGATVTRVSADGSEITYTYKTQSGVAAYWTTDGAGAHDKLTYSGDVWTWTDGDSQIVEIYDAHGTNNWRITNQTDRDGHGLTFTYSGDNLTKITTDDGGYLKYTWSGTQITSIETYENGGATKTLTRTHYAYDSYGRLETVTTDLTPEDSNVSDGNTYTTTYTYRGQYNLIEFITQSDGSSLELSYDANWRVDSIKQTVSAGEIRETRLVYDHENRWTMIRSSDGDATTLYYDDKAQLVRVEAPGELDAGETSQVRSVPKEADDFLHAVKFGDGYVFENAVIDGKESVRFLSSNGAQASWAPFAIGGEIKAEFHQTSSTMAVVPGERVSYSLEGRALTSGLTYAVWIRYKLEDGTQRTTAWRDSSSTSWTTLEASSVAPEGAVAAWVMLRSVRPDQNVSGSFNFAISNLTISSDRAVTTAEFSYDAVGNLIEASDSEGATTTYSHDDRGNVVRMVDPAGRTTVRSYNSDNQIQRESQLNTEFIGETGTIVTSDSDSNWRHINFKRPIENAVVVAGPMTTNGGDPGNVRVRNITDTGFDLQIDEWDYSDGPHTFETISWMAVSAGKHVLPGGQTIIAGESSVGASWASVHFGEDLGETPVVLAQVSSTNDPDAVVERVGNVSSTGFDALLQEQESTAWSHAEETLSWIALTAGGDAQTGDLVELTAGGAVNHNDKNLSWSTSLKELAFFADMQTTNGGDTATLRARSAPTSTGVAVFVEEERSGDEEIDHTNESIGYAVLRTGLLVGDSRPRPNLLSNPSADGGVMLQNTVPTDWRYWTNDPDGAYRYGVNWPVGEEWHADVPEGTFVFRQEDNQQGRNYQFASEFAVEGNKFYTASAFLGSHRAPGRVYIWWKGANGERLSSAAGIIQPNENYGGDKLTNYKRVFTTVQAPSWAVAGDIIIQKDSTAPESNDSWLFAVRPKVEQVVDASARPSDWVEFDERAPTSHSRFVYDSDGRLRYSIDPEGRVREYVYHTGNTITWGAGPGAKYVQQDDLRFVREYKSSFYPEGTDIPTETEMDAWRTSVVDLDDVGVRQLRYDLRGNVIEEVLHGGGLGAGGGPTLNDAGYKDTFYEYDTQGRVISKRISSLVAETFAYDGLGRMISSTDLNGGTTSITFNDVATQTTVTNAAGYTVVSTYNKAGELISTLDNGRFVNGGTDQYLYDDDGNLRTHIDATGNEFYYLYDNLNRKTAEISEDGTLVEYGYDNNGRLTSATRFGLGISTTHLSTLSGDSKNTLTIADIRPAIHSYDIREWSAYDENGQLVRTARGNGSVVAYSYDHLGNLITTTGYYNKLNSSQISDLRIGAAELMDYLPAENVKDSIVRTFYDRSSRVNGVLDGEGHLSQIVYDGAGNKVEEVAYASEASSAYWASGTFDQLLSSIVPNATKDARVRYVYDGQNQLRFEIDAENYVTEYVYTPDAGVKVIGLSRKTIQHFATLPSLADYSYATVKSAVDALGNASSNRTDWFVYDAHGQRVYAINTEGEVTQFSYDSSGRLMRTTHYAVRRMTTSLPEEADMNTWANANGAEARITRIYYTARGEKAYEIDPEGYVTGFVYDEEGRLYSQYRYANQLLPDHNWITDTVANANKGAAVVTHHRYDGQGRLRYTLHSDGTRTDQWYWKNGEVAEINRAYGSGRDQSNTRYTYDQGGNRNRVFEAYGSAAQAITDIYYDGLGNVVESKDAEANSTQFTYDKNGNVLTQTDAEGGVTSFEYDAFGNVVKVTDPRGNSSYNYYDQMGRINRQVDAEGGVTQFEYDTFGQLSKKTRFLSDALLYPSVGKTAVDLLTGENGEDVRLESPSGEFNAILTSNGELQVHSSQRLIWSSESAEHVNGARYRIVAQNDGNLSIYRIINGQNAGFVWGSGTGGSHNGSTFLLMQNDGNLVLYKGTGPSDNQGFIWGTINTGNSLNLPSNLKAETSFTYDDLGRLKTTTDAEGNTESSSYNAFGQVISSTNKIGGKTYFDYDDRGLLQRETVTILDDDGDDPVRTYLYKDYQYDARGNRIEMVESSAKKVDDGPIIVDSLTRSTTYEYDDNDQLIRTTGDEVEYYNTVHEKHDPANPPKAAPTEEFDYDKRGNVVEKRTLIVPSEIPADRVWSRTMFWYDRMDRVTHEVSATGVLTRHFYDANSNVIETRVYEDRIADIATLDPQIENAPAPADPVAPFRVSKFAYDRLNRLERSWVPNVKTGALNASGAYVLETGDLVTSYEYDANGNVVLSTDPNGGETYAWYDKLGRKTHQVDAEGFLTRWDYDENGNVLLEIRFAKAATGSYSASNLPNGGNIPSAVISSGDRKTIYSYDDLGQRKTETRLDVKIHNGTGGETTTDAVISYDYNGLGQVIRKTEASGDVFEYVYDTAGRLEEERRLGVEVFNNSHTNGIPNTPLRTARTYYNYTGLGDLSSTVQWGLATSEHRTTTYNYDAGGRLTSETDASGFTKSYSYDIAGRVLREEYSRKINDLDNEDNAIGYEYGLDGSVSKQGMMIASGENWEFGKIGAELDIQTFKHNAFGDLEARAFNGNDPYDTEVYKYDAAGRLVKTNSGDGVWKVLVYDKNGNQTLAITSTGADLSTLTVDQVLALWTGDIATTKASSDVVATITEYDAKGLVTKVLEPQRELTDTLTEDLETLRSYNAFGEIKSQKDARQNTIDFHYNTMGRLIQQMNPETDVWHEDGTKTENHRSTEKYYYDAAGRLVASRDANNNLTRRELVAGTGYGGSQALVARITTADGFFVDTAYNVFGNVASITDQVGRVTTQTVDKMGRVLQVNHAGGLIENYEYDGLGQRIGRSDNYHVDTETTAYDAQGRVIEQVAFGGDATSYDYEWVASVSSDLGAYGGWRTTTTFANDKTLTTESDIFGRQTKKTDMSGRITTYSYDEGGRLRVSGDSDGDDLDGDLYHSYFNTGRIKQSSVKIGEHANNWTHRKTKYGYDAAGNLKSENLTIEGEVFYSYEVDQDGSNDFYEEKTTETYKNATADYDALGRLIRWTEAGDATTNTPFAETEYFYDAVGNIRKIDAEYEVLDGEGEINDTIGNVHKEYWFRYDSLNRVVTTNGVLESDAIVRGDDGADIYYDFDGRRKYVITSFEDTGTLEEEVRRPGAQFTVIEPTEYPFTNTRKERYVYDDAGHLETVFVATQSALVPEGLEDHTAPGYWLQEATLASFEYNDIGQLKVQNDYGVGGGVTHQRKVDYNAKDQILKDTSFTLKYDPQQGNDTLKSVVDYTYETAEGNYLLGSTHSVNATNYELESGSASDTSAVWDKTGSSKTTYRYSWWDGAQTEEVRQNTYKDNGALDYYSNSDYYYLSLGGQANLYKVGAGKKIYQSDNRPLTINYISDLSGQIIGRSEKYMSSHAVDAGAPHEFWHRFGGKQLGYVGNNGSTSNLSYTDSISDRKKHAGNVFRNSDEAPETFADFSMGIAPINTYSQGGAGGVITASAGDTLSAIAARTYGDSSLWYKIAQANGLSGDVALAEGQSVRMPTGVMRNTHNASTFKPYSPGEAIGDTNPVGPPPPQADKGCGVIGMIIMVVVAVVVSIYTAGAASAFAAKALGLAAGTMGNAIAAGAIVGAAASAASQGVGVAIGAQDKFSWNSVAMGAIGGAVGGGLGVQFKGGGAWGAGARGAAGSAISQGIGDAIGISDFSWAGVAAAGVGSFVSESLLPSSDLRNIGESEGYLSANYIGAHMSRGAVSALASAATRSAIDGSNFGDNLRAAIPDVIGQAIGDAIGGWVNDQIEADPVDNSSGPGQSAVGDVDFGADPAAIARIRSRTPQVAEGLMAPLEAPRTPLTAGKSTALTLDEAIYGDFLLAATTSASMDRLNPLVMDTFVVTYRPSDYNIHATIGNYAAAAVVSARQEAYRESQMYALNSNRSHSMNLALAEMRADAFDRQVATAAGVGLATPFAAVAAVYGGEAALAWGGGIVIRNAPRAVGLVDDIGAATLGDALPAGQTLAAGGTALVGGVGVISENAAPIKSALGALLNKFRPACFTAGTLIQTKDGHKPIEAVRKGDWVWSRSEHDIGEASWRRVTNHACTGEKAICEVSITSASGLSETYRTTDNHPFWVETGGEDGNGAFIAAGALEPGDVLRLHDGSAAYVKSVVQTDVVEPVYNFTVDGWHTYHVGELGVWVHNDSCLVRALKAAGRWVEGVGAQGHHIVRQGKNVSPELRSLLDDVGVGIHEADNGVALIWHGPHSMNAAGGYDDLVYDRLERFAGDAEGIRGALRDIAGQLSEIDRIGPPAGWTPPKPGAKFNTVNYWVELNRPK